MRHIEEEINKLEKDKDESVAIQDFERAARLRDKADKLKKKKETIEREWKETRAEIEGCVNEEVVSDVVSKMTGIPVTRIQSAEAKRLLRMEEDLHKMIISQDEAVKAVAKAIRRSRAGLKNPNRPVASFIFVGPSGVGKTHLARSLAKFMFGEEDALVQIDMSEYMEKHNISRLIGAPPGYIGYEEGGQLTEKIRRRPYAVVLLDEIEKAHTDVFNMLLQIMEDGKLTDSFGRHVDFRNVIVIMTSNIGADVIKHQAALGFRKVSDEHTYEVMKEQLKKEVEKHFRPEFLNRVDNIIVFKPLSKDDLKKIIEIEMKNVKKRLDSYNITLTMSDEALEFLIDKGYDQHYGARPLRRAIESYLEDPLSEEVLQGKFEGKKHVKAKVQDNKLIFDEVVESPEPALVNAEDSV